ncbi:hypothetical protein HK104_011177 [Borealophlyctis nickersoniae]|nr:hypothetical protein HK104_011177 [Borealophlyctis nickersoniae]
MSTPLPTIPGFEGPLLASVDDTTFIGCLGNVCNFNEANATLRAQRAAEVCLKAAACASFVCSAKSPPNEAGCYYYRTPLFLIKPADASINEYTYIKNGKDYRDITNVTRRAAGPAVPSPSSTPLPKPPSPSPTQSSASISDSSSSSSSSSVNPAAYAVPIALVVVGLIAGGVWWWRRKRAPKNLEDVEFVEARGGGVPVLEHKG